MWINYRYSEPEQREEIERFAKGFREVRDFSFTWTRWKNWERYPPVVAMMNGNRIVGFQAITKSARTGYINFYYHAVSLIMQRQGIAKGMLNFSLNEFGGDVSRIKVKTHLHSLGIRFWKGFGFQPFGIKGEEYLWDEDISGVKCVDDLTEKMKSRELHNPIPDSSMVRYLKSGVTLLERQIWKSLWSVVIPVQGKAISSKS